MIIGDPYKFAVMFDRVADWNASLADNNGFFAFCINGKLFPNVIENAVLSADVKEVIESLSGIPVNKTIYNMDKANALMALYDLVYPEYDDKSDEENRDNDFRYLLSIHEMVDDDYLVFAVEGEDKIRILATKAEYDFKEGRYIFDNSEITEIYIEKDEINKIINQLEEKGQFFKKP